MPLKTGSQYLESLRQLKLSASMMGKAVENPSDHPIAAPSARAVALTFDLAHDAETCRLLTSPCGLSGGAVNRFTHLHQSTDDLVKKVLMQRLCGNRTACCFQRCVGMDAANAMFATTFDCDRAHGTGYHQRFTDYWKTVQENDLVVDGAMTDPKGDRGKRPKDQPDPDMFLRVVDRKPGGIVVRGAKLHQTGMANAHEILVMPTLSMRRGEEGWAVAFAVPTNAQGVKHIYGRQASDTRKLEAGFDAGNTCYGGQEVMTVFEDVFVPFERVFLNGETEFSGPLVELFAGYHRQSYGGCKVGTGDVLIGAAALMARMNGVENASHIKDKLVEMIHLNETMFACAIACSHLGHKTTAGNYAINTLLANVCKQNVTRFPFEIARLAIDIAGGLVGTMPSSADFDDPASGPYIKKYLAAATGVETGERMRLFRLLENLVAGSGAVAYLIESMHGAGPPQAQRIMIARQGNLEAKIGLAKNLIGV